MKARCICTLEQVNRNGWKKPDGGYKNPDLECEKCKGNGFIEVLEKHCKLKPIAVWIRFCPSCRTWSGTHIQYRRREIVDDKTLYRCFKPSCKGIHKWQRLRRERKTSR